MTLKIAPSILSSDFSKLGAEIQAVVDAGADYIHIDVMDGHFVPNITIGPMIVKAVREVTTLPLDVHLMISDPDQYIEAFVKAGADILTIHTETATHLHRSLQAIRLAGAKPGLAFNPATPLSGIEYVLDELSMVLIMTVNPGFESQQFIPQVVPKVKALKDLLDAHGKSSQIEIEVDGGISPKTIGQVAQAGADVFVAGSAVFYSPDYGQAIQALRQGAKF